MIIVSVILFLFFLILGACIGSFLTMASYRLPRGEEIIFKSSHCDKCGKELKIKSLIPIISFILQKGRCAECGEKISMRYFLIELTNSLMYSAIFLGFGFSFTSFYLCALFSLILMMIIIDIEHYVVPLYMQIGLILFLTLHVIGSPNDPLFLLFSGLVYYGVIELVRIGMEKMKNTEVLGGGDTKLIALCGVFLGFKNMGLFFLLTGILGVVFALIWKKKFNKNVFPFAPAILISLFMFLLIYYW